MIWLHSKSLYHVRMLALVAITGIFMVGGIEIEYRSTEMLPPTTVDQNGEVCLITGLSGITWAFDDQWFAVMDHNNKVLRLAIVVFGDGTINIDVRGCVTLARSGDYEDIAMVDDNSLILVDEDAQGLFQFDLTTGQLQRSYELPSIFKERRGNLGCESMCMDNGTIWVGNEEALKVDGATATPDASTVVRLVHGAPDFLLGSSQYAYEVAPMHGPTIPLGGSGRSGLCSLVQLPNHRLLALERSVALAGALFESRIYVVNDVHATDISTILTLPHHHITPMHKKLLYKGAHQNMEGLALGPVISPSAYLLLGIVDDGDPLSNNRVVVFTLRDDDPFRADSDGDGIVGMDDLLLLLVSWGDSAVCSPDLDDNGAVGTEDLFHLFAAWGTVTLE